MPGHPVSAMVIFHFFGKPIIKILSGLSREGIWHQIKIKAKASRNIPSVAGREDYVRVKLEEKEGALWADPVFGKYGAIHHLVQANGLIRIGINEEGLVAGEEAKSSSSKHRKRLTSKLECALNKPSGGMKRHIYLKKKTLQEAEAASAEVAKLIRLETETIPVIQSLGRVIAGTSFAKIPLHLFTVRPWTELPLKQRPPMERPKNRRRP